MKFIMDLTRDMGWIKDLIMLLGVLGVAIEIVPEPYIKLKPISWFLKYIGKKMFGEMFSEQKEKIEILEEKLVQIDNKTDDSDIDRIRYEILQFGNTCRAGNCHTRDEFQHILEINVKYHRLIEKRGLDNGILDADMEYIENLYKELSRKGKI